MRQQRFFAEIARFGEAELEEAGTLAEEGDAAGGKVGEGRVHAMNANNY